MSGVGYFAAALALLVAFFHPGLLYAATYTVAAVVGILVSAATHLPTTPTLLLLCVIEVAVTVAYVTHSRRRR